MEKHKEIKLNATERSDLGAVQKHPGVQVLVERIIAGHAQQQLEQIHTVQPDDPNRVTKLDGISAVAFAMKLNLELVRQELDYNWKILQAQEERAKAVKNESEKTQ